MGKLSQCIKEQVLELTNEYTNEFYKFYADEYNNSETYYSVLFGGQISADSTTRFKMLVVTINEEYKQISIPNIYIPETMEHKNIGKTLIYKIFNIAKENGYELFIIDMVPSFYRKLVNRGASRCEQEDVVKITENTRLI